MIWEFSFSKMWKKNWNFNLPRLTSSTLTIHIRRSRRYLSQLRHYFLTKHGSKFRQKHGSKIRQSLTQIFNDCYRQKFQIPIYVFVEKFKFDPCCRRSSKNWSMFSSKLRRCWTQSSFSIHVIHSDINYPWIFFSLPCSGLTFDNFL